MELKVSLTQHVGKQGTGFGDVDVKFDQCFVWCNGQRVGIYCGNADQPNKHLSFTDLPPLPASLQEQIAAKVAELTGGISHFTAPTPEEHEVADSDDE